MRDPILSVSVRRRPRLINLQPDDVATKRHMASLLMKWSRTDEGRTDVRLVYRSCGCSPLGSSIGHWTIEPRMLKRYGPLPFTSRGKPIRWRWRHTLLGNPSFTITASDLPEDLEAV